LFDLLSREMGTERKNKCSQPNLSLWQKQNTPGNLITSTQPIINGQNQNQSPMEQLYQKKKKKNQPKTIKSVNQGWSILRPEVFHFCDAEGGPSSLVGVE